LDPPVNPRSHEPGKELSGDEEGRRRKRALAPVVHEQGERNDPDAVAELVQRVRAEQATEGPHRERLKMSSHEPQCSRVVGRAKGPLKRCRSKS
jgi:hypothetical protein